MAKQPLTVLITGCSAGGIGHALALEYHTKGLRVLATARRMESMAELAALGMTTLELDVSDAESVTGVKNKVTQLTDGRLDILVNNAGKVYNIPAVDYDMQLVRQLFDVNVFAVMNMCKEFSPLLRNSLHPHGAKIVNIGSIAGVISPPFGGAYNATKAALHAYGDALRIELQPFNIGVISVVTGGVKSNIVDNNVYDFPPDTIYEGMGEAFHKLLQRLVGDAMPAADYATKVVNMTLKASPSPWIWVGSSSTMIRTLNALGWTRLYDRIFARMFGLRDFEKRLKAKR